MNPVIAASLIRKAPAGNVVFNGGGTFDWQVPEGITALLTEGWGGGSPGLPGTGFNGGAGGCSGTRCYNSYSFAVPVVGLEMLTLVVPDLYPGIAYGATMPTGDRHTSLYRGSTLLFRASGALGQTPSAISNCVGQTRTIGGSGVAQNAGAGGRGGHSPAGNTASSGAGGAQTVAGAQPGAGGGGSSNTMGSVSGAGAPGRLYLAWQ